MERVVPLQPQEKVLLLRAVERIVPFGPLDDADLTVYLLPAPDHAIRKDDLLQLVGIVRKPIGDADIFPVPADIQDQVRSVRRRRHHRPINAGTERQAIAPLGVDDEIAAVAQVPRVGVVSALAPQFVVPLASDKDVVPVAAIDRVVSSKAVYDVGLRGPV